MIDRANKLRSGAALSAFLLLAACASGPPHGGRHFRGGPGEGAGGGNERPSLIVRPGALLLIDLDADHDMRVSKAELESSAAGLFARADTNHDGALSPLEFDAFARAHMGTPDATPGRLSFDTNADNIITPIEFTAGMEKLFADFDADHDGYVTRAEMVQRLEAPSFERPSGGPGEGGYGGGRGGRGGRGDGGGGPGGGP